MNIRQIFNKVVIGIILLESFQGLYAETKVISIGSDCTVATLIRQLNLRAEAYPFDWIYSHFESLYNVLNDDFKFFLDPNSLKLNNNNDIIVDFYNFGFVHDFPTIHHDAALNDHQTVVNGKIRDDWQEFIGLVRVKYQRRIERFRNELSGNNRVFLVRYGIDQAQAIKLRDLLIDRYPNLDFIIIAVSGVENEIDWGLDKIRNYGIPYIPGENFKSAWENVFKSLNII